MYKVCIIDDQPFVREGLRKIIDWKSLDCEVVADWGTGIAAIGELERIQPDIVVSDIVMPGLDGLALKEMLNQLHISVQVIFLSAHRKFEYAQRAIELGAVEYLLKPTDPNEVIRAVVKCIHRIHEDRKLIAHPQNAYQLDGGTRQEQEILSLVIHDNPPVEPVLLDLEMYYSVIAIRYDEASNILLKMQKSIELLHRKLILGNPFYIFQVIDKIIVVFVSANLIKLQKQMIEWAEEIQFWHRQFLDISISIGISQSLKGPSFLHSQYLETLKALEMTFYYGQNTILSFTETSSEAEKVEKIDTMTSVNKEEQLLEVIKHGNEEKVLYLMEKWFAEFVKEQVDEYDIKFQIYKWIFYVVLHVPLAPDDKLAWEKQAQSILTTNTLIEIKETLGNMIHLMISYYKSDFSDYHQVVIHEVENYIHQHYHEQETSLTVVAEHVHLSPNYVSRLIKQKIGRTFTEWLNEFRMEEAKKLLQNKNNKAYWVAEKVGIPDARYFSQLFRKYTNVSPSDYKNQMV